MAYLDYPGLSYFKSLLDETYLRTSYTGDTTIAGDVTFTGDTVFSKDITGNVDGKAKKDWRGQQIDSTYIKSISTNDNVGQIVYTKGDDTSNYIMIDMMQGATASAAGKAGLVPAPTISERTKFLMGNGEWGVPTDIYVTQNLINTNDSFPILIGATAGATQSQVGTAIAFGTKVSVNPNTHALIADHLILKHPTYRRSNNISSKVMYTLNFADSDDGNGNNLSEIYGYIDPAANGGEHELGFRLFGNPNVQGVEEIFTYLSVGLSKTNIPYGHAPSTPLPADHNEPTDIITRDWLARNGSETGLVHTSMNETIGGVKTFTDETRNTSTAGITTTKLTATGKITGTGTAEISGGSGNTPSLKVTGNETVTGDLSVGGNETVSGNETVGGTLAVTGKITGDGGIDTTTLHATDDVIVDDDLTVGDTITVGGQILKKTGTNTTQEYVSYITNQQETRNTIITNVIKPNGGLAIVSSGNDKGKIYVNTGDGLSIDNSGNINVDFRDPDPEFIRGIINGMIPRDGNGDYTGGLAAIEDETDPNDGKLIVDFSKLPSDKMIAIVRSMVAPGGGIYYVDETAQFLHEGDTYIDKNGVSRTVTAAQEAQTENGFPNPNYGKLLVDFSKMDQSVRDDIVSALDMQVPLRKSYTFYVNQQTGSADNANTSNVKVTEVLKSPSTHKFDTIQRCVTWVTTNLAIGSFNVTIVIEARLEGPENAKKAVDTVYNESVTLPTFTHSTGQIQLVGEYTNYYNDNNRYSVNSDVKEKLITIHSTIRNSDGMSIAPITVEGADWYIRYLTLYYEPHETISKGLVGSCLTCRNNGLAYVHACSYKLKYPRNGNDIDFYPYNATIPDGSDRIASEKIGMRMIFTDIGGRLHFMANWTLTEQPEIYCENMTGNETHVLYCVRDSSITFHNTYDTGFYSSSSPVVDRRAINCAGECDSFLYCSNGSILNYGGGEGNIFVDGDHANAPMQCSPFEVKEGGNITFAGGLMYPGTFREFPTEEVNGVTTPVIPPFDDTYWDYYIERSSYSFVKGNVSRAATIISDTETYYASQS